jgi:hypothetical protein
MHVAGFFFCFSLICIVSQKCEVSAIGSNCSASSPLLPSLSLHCRKQPFELSRSQHGERSLASPSAAFHAHGICQGLPRMDPCYQQLGRFYACYTSRCPYTNTNTNTTLQPLLLATRVFATLLSPWHRPPFVTHKGVFATFS